MLKLTEQAGVLEVIKTGPARGRGMRMMVDPQPSVVELEQSLARVGDDRSFCRERLDMMLAYAPAQVAEIRRALANEDASRVERVAHSVKGAAANLAPGPTRDASAELERPGQTGDPADAMQALAGLEKSLGELASCSSEMR